jgi:hypothetical protein
MDFEIRSERGNYGRRPLAREREEYLRLVDLGKSDTEALSHPSPMGDGWEKDLAHQG